MYDKSKNHTEKLIKGKEFLVRDTIFAHNYKKFTTALSWTT